MCLHTASCSHVASSDLQRCFATPTVRLPKSHFALDGAKHLEHIFEKLGMETRTATALASRIHYPK